MKKEQNSQTAETQALNIPVVGSSTFFICGEKVIQAFPECEHSKPFKSGFENDDDNNYVALLDFEKVEQHYNQLPEDEQDDFWCRECVPGQMDVSKFTLSGMRKNGIFAEIRWKLDLTATRNQAMTIFNLAEKFNCTPLQLINKIVR
jgi:hypothetical protein